MTEENPERLEWLGKNGPLIVAAATAVAFVTIRMAGHPTSTALLVAAIMFAFATFIWKVREWFGVKIGAIIAFGLAAILWLWMKLGWI